jgi:hypothetical protein
MVDIVQGTTAASYLYPGTSGSDRYAASFNLVNRGTVAAPINEFLTGTYKITSGLGSDSFVAKLTDYTSRPYFPQHFELFQTPGSNSYTPALVPYDLRPQPLRVEFLDFDPSFNKDKTTTELYQTGVVDPIGTRTRTLQFIDGPNSGAAAFLVDTATTTGLYKEADRVDLGVFYVNNGNNGLLSALPSTASFNGVTSPAYAAFDEYIFTKVKDQVQTFTSNPALTRLKVGIDVDSGALDSGRRYLNLAGQLTDVAVTDPSFKVTIPNVRYTLNIDLSSVSGLTTREVEFSNKYDDVTYSGLGIINSTTAGYVNNDSSLGRSQTNPNGHSVTLTTGNFDSSGVAAEKKVAIIAIDMTGPAAGSFFTLEDGHGFSVGDSVSLQPNSTNIQTDASNLNTYTVYNITDVAGNQVKIAKMNGSFASTTNVKEFGAGASHIGDSFVKLTGYNVVVERVIPDITGTNVFPKNAKDVFGGFEGFTLTTGDDTVNFKGVASKSQNSGGLTVNTSAGADTWNIAAKEYGNWGDGFLNIDAGWEYPAISGATKGLFVNLSGQSQTWDGKTLSGSNNSGLMRDNFDSIDTIYISSKYTDPAAGYSDTVNLSFHGTTASDRFYLAADGFGTINQYGIEGTSGLDTYNLNSAVNPNSLAPFVSVTSTNLTGLLAGNGTANVESNARFFDAAANYKVSFALEGSSSSQKLVATLADVAQITNASTSTLTVSDTSGWSVGDTVIYRAATGDNGVTGLVNGTSYRVTSVLGSTVGLATTATTPVNPITVMDAQTLGSSLEHIVSTTGAVDGLFANGVLSGGYVTFDDDAGQFSRLSIRLDGKVTQQTTLSFTAASNVEKFTANQTYWTDDLSRPSDHAAFSINYQNVWESQPLTVTKTGINYFNGIVDKGVLGFDRLVDYQDSATVGGRQFGMTNYDDTMIQLTGTSSIQLELVAGKGSDKVFVEGISSDTNQRTVVNLGDLYGSKDGAIDALEIGVSRLSKAYNSVQYIDVSNADSSDTIKFVDAAGYTVVKNTMETGDTPGSYKNYASYSVYEGTNQLDNLVMMVRVSETTDFRTSQNYDLSSNSNWGLSTLDPRSITGSPTAISMSANADNVLLFEDTTTSPYLMGEGKDYVVTMGGDQDIALGGGDDFISVRNYGQTLFVSGGAGTDQIGLGGGYSILSNGTYVSDQWNFGSMEVSKAKEFLAAKYPTLSTATDPFAWDSGILDRVMVATNRIDGTIVYFQTEEIGFSNGPINTGNFLPPIVETYDTTARSLAPTTLYGRSTNDTINLKVANVDEALKHIGSWLDSTTVAPILTGSTLVGSHALEIKAQPTAAGTPAWFSGNPAIANGGFKLVDIENIRLFDNAGKEVTVRVAGSSAYESVNDAVQYANRGDVIFIAETKEGALTATTRAAVNMETTVSLASGLRVAFEEGANRTVNATSQLTVNMTTDVKSSSTDAGFFGTTTRALEVLGSANINVNGTALSDLIIGNKGNNVINGGAGNDILFGGNGSDMLIGSVGDDTLIGGSSHRVASLQHTPDDGVFTGVNLSTDEFVFHTGKYSEFQTGDKVIYKASGGSGIAVSGTALTEASPLYIIRTDNADLSFTFKLANTLANANNKVALDITSNGTATTHGVTLDNVTYAAGNLPGSDYLYGGSGKDHLIATGVMGSLGTAATRDTLTANGGSGSDTFTVFGNSGQINVFGGSGEDKLEVFDSFLDVSGVNKGLRMVDFAAAQDDIYSGFSQTQLGGSSIETRLSDSKVTLSQLVSPPLPIVNGSGENGNYQQTSQQSTASYGLDIGTYHLSVADLILLHNAHAA